MKLFEQPEVRCGDCEKHDAIHESGHAVVAVLAYRQIRRDLYRYYLKQIDDMQDLAGLGVANEDDVEQAWDTLDRITRGPVDEVSIRPIGMSNGRLAHAYFLGERDLEDAEDDPAFRTIAEAECQVAVAGFAAQRLFDPQSVVNQDWGVDAARPLEILHAIEGDGYVDRLQELLAVTEALLMKPEIWSAVEVLAELLVERETVSGAEARDLVEKMVFN